MHPHGQGQVLRGVLLLVLLDLPQVSRIHGPDLSVWELRGGVQVDDVPGQVFLALHVLVDLE
jgi:hypothetical protein